MNRWGWPELIVRLAVVAAVSAAVWFFAWPGVNPHVWEDLSIAAGLRPPSDALSGWWRWILSELLGRMPDATLVQTLRLAGVAGAGLAAYLTFGILNTILPTAIRFGIRERKGGWLIVDLVLVLGTLSFCCTEAVWCSCQVAGAPLGQILVALSAVRLTLDFLQNGGIGRVYAATVLFALMAGEGAIGCVAFVALWAMVFYKSLVNRDDKTNPLANPVTRNSLLKRMTGVYVLLTVYLVLVNYRVYRDFGGVEQSAFFPADLVMVIFGSYLRNLQSVTPPLGWLFVFVFTLAPAVIAFASLPKVLVDDRLQARRFAMALFAMGVVAWSQVSGFQSLWAHGWFAAVALPDAFTAAMLALIGVMTLTWSFVALFLNTHFRHFKTVAGYQFGDEAEIPAADRALRHMVRFNRALKVGAWVLLLAALAGTLPWRGQGTLRRMLEVVDDYCREVVRECGDAEILVTDGALDEGVELAAHGAGHRLVTLSMLSGGEKHDILVRQRAAVSDEEKELLERSVSSALYHWRTQDAGRLSQVALQYGFRRQQSGDAQPPWLSGLLGRPGGGSTEAAAAGIAAAHRLGERVLEICEREDPDGVADGRVRELFRFVQWRIAQMCRVRNDWADARTWGKAERLDEELSGRLDESNSVLQRLKNRLERTLSSVEAELTPWEGLVLGLQRADFQLAKTFAETVIRQEPDNVRANFALGMYHLTNGDDRKAIPYFERVLAKRGDEPTVLNNLATAHSHLGHAAEAVRYAERAHKALPDNARILENLKAFRKVLDDAPHRE